jgi:hypothetical protein
MHTVSVFFFVDVNAGKIIYTKEGTNIKWNEVPNSEEEIQLYPA